MKRLVIAPLAAFLVVGCGESGGTPNPTPSPTNQPPVITSVSSQTVIAGESLTFSISVSDPEGHNVTLSTDGTLGPFGDPYTAATAATFDTITGLFAWTPTTNELGDYSVQFTAVDDGDPPASDTLDVTITVDPVPIPSDGDIIITEILYNPNGADDGLEWIELYNNDSIQIEIGGWRMCGASFSYDTLPQNIVLDPGDYVVIHWNTVGATQNDPPGHYYTMAQTPMGNVTGGTAKSMALYYSAGAFTSAAAMRDFVQWIDPDQARSNVAQAATLWQMADSVPDVTEGSSICYNGGDGESSAGYSADSSPTPLADNGACN